MKENFLFYKMPKDFDIALFAPYLSKAAICVYVHLAKWYMPVDSQWTAPVTNAVLESELSYFHRVTISRAKRELIESGLIEERDFIVKGRIKRGIHTYYMKPSQDALSSLAKKKRDGKRKQKA